MSYPGYPQQGAPSGYPSPYHATSQLSYPGYPNPGQPSYQTNHAQNNMYTLNPSPSMHPQPTTSSMYPSLPPQPGFSPSQQGYPPSNTSSYPGGYSQSSNPGYPTNNNTSPYPTSGSNPGMPSPYPSHGLGFVPSAPTSFNMPPQPPYNPMGSAPASFNTPPLPPYNPMGSAPSTFNSHSQPPYNPSGSSTGYLPLQAAYATSSSLNASAPSAYTAQSQYNPAGQASGRSLYPQQQQGAYSATAGMQGYSVIQPKGTPTVRPYPGFNARQDAEVMRKAMKGFGTDEQAIINVLAHRTNEQRQQIAMQFKTLYGKDIIKDLKSELSGRFEELVLALMTPLPQFYAQELRKSVTGLGTDEAAIIEVLCTLDNHYIRIIRSAYESMYRTSLEKDMGGDTSGSFKRLLVSLCGANRDESTSVDQAACAADAQALLRAGVQRFGTDEATFNAILCSRSYAHLRQVFVEYERLAGHNFEKAVKGEFSGDIEAGMLAIVKSVRNKSSFFAERLYASMAGMGTMDRTLIRIVVTRSEVDMVDIKREFQAKYGKTLENFISGDTSGDYKKCLIALMT